MPYAYQIHKQESAYFLTMTAVEWVDALMRREHKQIICESLNYCVDKKGLEIFAYVSMTKVHTLNWAESRCGTAI